LSLTTPVPRDEDTTFPGEGWFYYWKTSASLWRSKLSEYQKGGLVFVPLNWSFHSETGDHYDFAEHRPETDLKKLNTIANELGKKMIFLLPLGPAPFLPNGGLPHFLARTAAVNDEGLPQFAIDADGSINKLYSFYDNRVYQAFTKFTYQLSQYISRTGINCDIFGLRCYSYCRHQSVKSFMSDRSPVFEQSFARFLKARREEIEVDINSPEVEWLLRAEYGKTIESLYETNASEAFSAQWEGVLDAAFLGTSSEDNFSRLGNQHSEQKYSWDILEILSRDMVPSTVMLPARIKKTLLKKQSDELVLNSFLLNKAETLQDEDGSFFQPLIHFEIGDLPTSKSFLKHNWQSNGLLPFLKTTFPFSYRLRSGDQFKFSDEQEARERLTFFLGENIQKQNFHLMLKLFMSGGKVVLDRTGMSSEFLKKLEVFFIENSLKIEKVNFHTHIHNIILGEGRMVVFEGEKLHTLEPGKVFSFWQKLIETFSLRLLTLDSTDPIVHYWRTRAANSNELNYEEIRRVSLYNPSSYKRKFLIQLPKHFVLLKVIDALHVEVIPKKSQIEVMMMPEGSASIDFGVFS